MSNTIRVETEFDSICLLGDRIQAVVDSTEYTYELSSVNRIVLITTDLGPLQDDMGLAIDIGNDDVISIMSEHKCFKPFLFDQIGKVLPINYQGIIDASSCADNGVFEIYVREGSAESSR